MNANWEPPLTRRRLSAMVCQKLRPAVTAKARNEIPWSPAATLMERPTRKGETHAGE